MQKFCELTAEITNIKQDLAVGLKAVNKKVLATERMLVNVVHDIENLRTTISALENDKVAADVIIHYVPNEIDAVVAVGKIVDGLPGSLKVCNAFRTRKAVSGDKPIPIIAKMTSAEDRVRLFRALAKLRVEKKRNLQFCDVGIDSEQNVAIYECLSRVNKELLSNAIKYKSDKLLFSAFSLRGNIYVRKKADDQAIKIINTNTLAKVVGGV